MNSTNNLIAKDIDDKGKKISALSKLAKDELEILGKEKQEIVKEFKFKEDEQHIKKLKEELGLKKPAENQQ